MVFENLEKTSEKANLETHEKTMKKYFKKPSTARKPTKKC